MFILLVEFDKCMADIELAFCSYACPFQSDFREGNNLQEAIIGRLRGKRTSKVIQPVGIRQLILVVLTGRFSRITLIALVFHRAIFKDKNEFH